MVKRFLVFLIAAFMALSLFACSSGNTEQTASTPKVEEAAPSPAGSNTAPATTEQAKPAEPAPSQDASKAPDASAQAPSPANGSSASGAPAAGDTSKPAPAGEASKPASAEPSGSKTPAPEPSKSNPQPAAPPKQEPPAQQPPAQQPAPAKPDPAPAAKPEISPQGKKLLFVGRDQDPLPAEDQAIMDRLKKMGFSVTHSIDREFTADATKGYDMIYISQTMNSKFLKGGVMKDVAIPTLYVKNHGMFYLGLSSVEENTTVKKSKTIEIVDASHKIAAGLSGTVDVYKEIGDNFGVSYGVPGKEAKVVATVPGDKTKAALYYYDKGAKADNGYVTKARVSFYYWSNGMHENSTDAGWKLWDNIVLWTLQNG
ncbi:hypothetical protein ACFFK0_00120 [Paenibacillus chartarius]|uniref:Uncharacterized protein n=1 Tax=Paenibacillus chartarius TaxID=747481 RepID=A0ABV6DDZ2_9BACL